MKTGRKVTPANVVKGAVGISYNLFILLMVLVAAVIVLSTINTPFKLKLFAVLSGSMEPAISMGSLVIVMPQSTYAVNDVITVQGAKDPTETVTHRIVSKTEGSAPQYTLKGDANEEIDREVIPANRVVGKVFVHLPYVGRIISFAQTQMGFIIMIVVPATILLYSELIAIKGEVVKMIKREPKSGWKAEGKQMVIITQGRKQVGETPKIKTPVAVHHVVKKHVEAKKAGSIAETDVSIRRPRKPITFIPLESHRLNPAPVLSMKTLAKQKMNHVLHIDGGEKKVVISN